MKNHSEPHAWPESLRGMQPGPRRGAAFRIWARGAVVVALLIAAAAGGLATHGLPGPLIRKMEAGLSRSGWTVHIHRLRWRGGGTWTAARCTVQPATEAEALALRAGSVSLQLDWAESLHRKQPWIVAVTVTNASIRWAGSDAAAEPIQDVYASARHTPAGWQVDDLGGRWRGLSLRVAGLFLHPAPGAPPASMALKRMPWPRIREVWNSPHWPAWSGPARFKADVLWDPAHPTDPRITLSGGGGTLVWNGIPAQRWIMDAGIHAGRIQLQRLEAENSDGEKLFLQGEARFQDRTCDWEGRGAIFLDRWRALPLPPELFERARRSGMRSGVPVEWNARVFNAPWSDPARELWGRFHGRQLSALGIEAEEASAQVRRDGQRWYFDEAEGRPGRGDRAGRVAGSGFYDFASRTYGFDGQADVYPEAILPLLNPMQAMHAGGLVCRGAPPHFSGSVRGAVSDFDALKVAGCVTLSDAVYHGSAFSNASGQITVTNRVLVLSPMRVDGAYGAIMGSVTQDFSHATVDFDVDSYMSPPDVARLAGPAAHRLAQRLRFEGPAHVLARGRVDLGPDRAHRITAEVDAQRMGLRWLLADEAQMNIEVQGRKVWVRDLRGRMGDGAFQGNVEFDLPEGDQLHTAYLINGTVSNSWVHTWIPATMGPSNRESLGRVTGRLKLSGLIGEGQGMTARGEGTLDVHDGRLLEIPLLGPISRLLQHLIPGAGMAEQTAFQADVDIRDGRVHSTNAYLLGSTVSLEASGSVGFGGDLKFTVQLKLLRQGPVASVLRVITFPVTKLFEFNLSGTLGRPEWEPRNFPKELLLQFD